MKPSATGRAFVVALFSCAVMVACAAVAHAEATIGLYRDSRGTACSFTDNAPGVVTVHVVFRPDDRGFRGVRFSAPVPSCFGGVWILDTPTERTHLIGDSQTGISVASSWCEEAPIEILQIQYYQNGSTSSCCEFPVLEDPFVHMIEANDCNFESFVASGTTAYFNADASCRCGTNAPPGIPSNPSPPDGETFAAITSALSWVVEDPDSNLASYDLYLGTSPLPPLFAAGLTQPSFQPPAPLDELTTYYWRVVARDEWDVETPGPVWTFTTRMANSPPHAPYAPWPTIGMTGVLLTAQLIWTCIDVDNDPLVYDMYFGTTMAPPLAAANLATARFAPTMEWDTYYYWRVVARDPHGNETSGPVWGFRTRPENYPPEIPSSPSPVNGATSRPFNGTLTWVCSDKDAGDTVVYDVYFGSTSPPPIVATGRTTKSYSYSGLDESTVYYWQIIARDNHGATTAGPIWSFRTEGNDPPGVPYNPSPPANSTGASVLSILAWQCTDPDGDALKFDVYFGTVAVPPRVATNITTKSYSVPVPLAFTTQYYWRVVARDPKGLETASATWTFTTRADGPPTSPASPSPGNGATNVALNATLSWQCTESDGQPMTFDVYFGTTSPPPQVAAGITTKSYAPGPMLLQTRYYWYVVAHDNTGHETIGPAWSFTSRNNSAPNAPSSPSPANNAQSISAPTLTWTCSDPDGQALTYNIYFGDTSTPPLVATGLSARSYSPGPLLSPKTYYWQVVAFDGYLTRTGPVWSFTTVAPGDVNQDGQITVADATCVMDRVMGIACGTSLASDVDCSNTVTPRDARCIHRRALAMECAFCGQPATMTAGVAGTPGIGVLNSWETRDTLFCRLGVWNVPSFEAFAFSVSSAGTFIGARRVGLTNDWISIRRAANLVAGYTITGSPTQPAVASEFIDLRFKPAVGTDWVMISGFVDDLAGASPIYFELGGGIPVLISRFEAAPVAGGIEVSWSLESDEAMESFTLYRSDDGSPSMPVASGAVNGRTGRHLDTSVSPGSAYQYELLVRTAAGGEFRSQPVRATMAAFELALHQNHPNPFNPQTAIRYDLPPGERTVRVRLWILDVNGRIVRRLVDEDQPGGSREVTWNGTDDRGNTVSSGVYFYVLDVEGKRLTRKLVLLK